MYTLFTYINGEALIHFFNDSPQLMFVKYRLHTISPANSATCFLSSISKLHSIYYCLVFPVRLSYEKLNEVDWLPADVNVVRALLDVSAS